MTQHPLRLPSDTDLVAINARIADGKVVRPAALRVIVSWASGTGSGTRADVHFAAAVYLLGLATLGAFAQRNDQTAILATTLVLRLNGLELDLLPAETAYIVRQAAAYAMEPAAIAAWLADHSQPVT